MLFNSHRGLSGIGLDVIEDITTSSFSDVPTTNIIYISLITWSIIMCLELGVELTNESDVRVEIPMVFHKSFCRINSSGCMLV